MQELLYNIGQIILYCFPLGFVAGFIIAWKFHNSNSKLVRIGVGCCTGVVISFIILFAGVSLTSTFGSYPV